MANLIEGMTLVFGRVPGIAVVGDGACAEDAVRLAGTLKPDIILFTLISLAVG